MSTRAHAMLLFFAVLKNSPSEGNEPSGHSRIARKGSTWLSKGIAVFSALEARAP
jgi:hypothetical protein